MNYSTTPTITIDSGLLSQYGALLGPYGITLYCALSFFSGPAHQCQPALRNIVAVTGMSTSQVHRETRKLVALGLIAVVPQVDPVTKEHSPHQYIILPLPPSQERDPSQLHLRNRDLAITKNNGRCVYCGSLADTVDHVIPKSRGGANDYDNLVPACSNCNHRKGTRLDWSPE